VKRPLFSLEGSVAVVTGALGLLGRQHCLALAAAGASVAVADLDDHLSSEFAHDLGATHERATLGRGVDVTDPESVAAFAIEVERVLGPVDVLVNNAAIDDKFIPVPEHPPGAFEAYELERWRAQLDVNVTGAFLCSREIGVRMARRKRGSIVNVASTYGLVAPDQSLYRRDDGTQVFFKGPAYSTSKGGVAAFTRFLAAYWGSCGVRVNTLSPGGVRTGQDDDFVDRYARRTPLGRMASPDDYHGAIVFLASDASAYMTGANLVVDGGWTAW
jgi:NAD(P)-dependent dehydrogenase (short-subunit alcohol dehydrogenase family)